MKFPLCLISEASDEDDAIRSRSGRLAGGTWELVFTTPLVPSSNRKYCIVRRLLTSDAISATADDTQKEQYVKTTLLFD